MTLTLSAHTFATCCELLSIPYALRRTSSPPARRSTLSGPSCRTIGALSNACHTDLSIRTLRSSVNGGSSAGATSTRRSTERALSALRLSPDAVRSLGVTTDVRAVGKTAFHFSPLDTDLRSIIRQRLMRSTGLSTGTATRKWYARDTGVLHLFDFDHPDRPNHGEVTRASVTPLLAVIRDRNRRRR